MMDEKELSNQEAETIIEENLSILEDSLSAFDWLTKRKYKISLAHNEKEINVDLVFLQKNYVHAAGIDKLTDISSISKHSHAALYREMIKNKGLRRQIASSSCFNDIIGRLYSIIDLKYNFEDAENNRHFKFVKKLGFNYTLIDYDFFIETKYEKDTYYYFLRYSENPENENECVLISTFIDNVKDYSIGQERMTLLKKVLVELKTNCERLIYIHND